MAYSLAEAAEATGKVKSTIFKACKSGKISYNTDTNGHFQIEPAELHRVFPAVSKNTDVSAEDETEKTLRNAEFGDENGFGNRLLRQELSFLREKLASLEQLKEDDRGALSERIEDLRRDRDDLRGERDKLLKVIDEQAGSMRLLTDRRDQVTQNDRPKAQAAVPNSVETRSGGFFGRLFRRRT